MADHMNSAPKSREIFPDRETASKAFSELFAIPKFLTP